MGIRTELVSVAATLLNAINGIHPNWAECRGSSIVINRAQKILHSNPTIIELKRVGRSLYRLWSTFKDDYEDWSYVTPLVKKAKILK